MIGFLLLPLLLGSQTQSCAHSSADSNSQVTEKRPAVTLDALRVVALTQRGRNRGTTVINGWKENDSFRLAPSPKFRLTIRLHNASYNNDFVVWTTIDSVVAPMATEFLSGALDPGDYVSWGWDTQFDDLRTQIVHGLKEGDTRNITLGDFDLSPMMKMFDYPDNLWLWEVRIHVHVLDREGHEAILTSPRYRLIPSRKRSEHPSHFDPSAPDGEPIPIVERPCKDTKQP